MTYVDAYWVKAQDIIRVVERTTDNKRVFREYPAPYDLYYVHPSGKYTSIFGEPLKRVSCATHKQFAKEIANNQDRKLYESDFNPVFTCLERNYLNCEIPKLNVAYFDIEVDFDPTRGYASPDDAFMPITAISIYLQWIDELICLAVPPKTLTISQAEEIVKDLPNTFIFESESELLNTFLNLIEDADVLSGWNSELFDIPYTVNRVIKVLSRNDSRRFCLWDELPRKKEFEKHGRTSYSYDLIGRIHLDSLELYRKYNYEERHSYRLDAIGELELGETKVAYEGTLDQLYNHDFRKFIEYSRQDTLLLHKLDQKLKFMDLANTIAHENTVLIPTTMGAVTVIEQAIINEAHRLGLCVPSRLRKSERSNDQAAGAYVAYPKKGLHEWVGSVDINSLYPSTIRALNMGPETIIGQLNQNYTDSEIERKMLKGMSFAAAWEGKFGSNEYEMVMSKDRAHEITVNWTDGRSEIMSGAQIYDMMFNENNPWIISANGTIFTYEREGVIPGLLARWYRERKEMQAKLRQAIEIGNKIEEEYWDKRQLVKKILLNSLYGALLNSGCRFFDKRIGQSTTLTGRRITRHMSSKINEIITGEYNHVGSSIIYGDTDSSYFSAYESLKDDINNGILKWDKDTVVQLYDEIANQVNGTFSKFMQDDFHVPRSRGEVIKAGREIVASKGLFITKKRYAVLYYDKEGTRLDVNGKSGKVKAMGLDLKRSDTPDYMQKFLDELLHMVLKGYPQEEIIKHISQFREDFRKKPGWEKGTPKRVNNIVGYQAKLDKNGKVTVPGHVRAAMNWNTLKRLNGDQYSMQIVDGMKVIVCKLKNNPMDINSVAYPTDELRLPAWFQELPFDHDSMESVIIDNKLDNLIGVLNYDLDSTNNHNAFSQLFSFS